MSKKSTIKSLLVLPLIASAILLSNPVLAANNQDTVPHKEIRHKSTGASSKKGIAGTVKSINGSIIIVTTKDNTEYTVDASHATIMKTTDSTDQNPSIINTADIHVGDFVMIRGKVADSDINADEIFDGKVSTKSGKYLRNHL